MDSPAWRPTGLVRYGAAAALFGAAIALWLHEVVFHPGSRIAGGFGDGTGALRDYWSAQAQHRTPFDLTHDALNGAPEGFARTPATVLANSGAQTVFVWFSRDAVGLVGAWNTFLFLGLFVTALATFALLDRLGCTFWASMFGASVFAFSPYAVERVDAGHLGLVHNWVFVVVLATLLRWSSTRTLGWSAAVGGAIGLAFYVTAYQGLLASLMAAVFFVVEIVRPGGRGVRLRSSALGGFAYLVAIASLVPIFVLYLRERSTVRATAGHAGGDLFQYAASLSGYLVPSPRNPLLRRLGDTGPVHGLLGLHPSNLTEDTLFFGYTTAAFAVVAVVLLLRRDSRLRESEPRWRAAVFAAVLAPVAFLLSFAPTYRLGGVAVPRPSWLLSQVSTYWRVYSRFGLLVGLALAILAALALTALARRPGRFWRLLPALALAIVAIELLPPNLHTLDTTFRPGWVAWLAAEPRGIVATYPALGPGAPGLDQQDSWYQTFDHDPRFAIAEASTSVAQSRDQAIRFVARDLGDPVSARVLSTEGVRYVVIHDDVYRAGGRTPPALDPRFYTQLAHLGDVRIFRVHAKPLALARVLDANRYVIASLQGLDPPGVAYESGFNLPEPYQGSTGRWLAGDGRLAVQNPGQPLEATLSGLAFSNGQPRLLEVEDGAGNVVARQRIPAFAVPLALGPIAVPHGSSTLTLITVPGADPLGGSDPRTASVFLSGLELKPLPAYAGA